MRAIAILLLIANVCLLAFAQLGALGSAPDPSLAPLKSERIRQLSPQQVAALGPSKAAQLNITCAEWGPFTEKERIAVQPLLDGLKLGKTISTQRVEISDPFWVYVPPKVNRGAMERALAELSKLGVPDAAGITDESDDHFAISLGVYRSESAAFDRLKAVEDIGVKNAKVGKRKTTIAATTFIVREPQQATIAALEEAKKKWLGSELQVQSCRDRPS